MLMTFLWYLLHFWLILLFYCLILPNLVTRSYFAWRRKVTWVRNYPLLLKSALKKIRNAEPKISLGTAFASVSVCVSREQHLGIELKTTPDPTALQTSVSWKHLFHNFKYLVCDDISPVHALSGYVPFMWLQSKSGDSMVTVFKINETLIGFLVDYNDISIL